MHLVGPSLTRLNWEYQGNLGLLWVAAAVLAPCLRGGPVRFQAVVAALLVLFGLGGGLLLQGLPGFRLFQLPVRMLLVAPLPLALLAGHTTQALLYRPAGGLHRRSVVLAAVALLAGALLIAWPLALLLANGERPAFHPYWLILPLTVPVFLWLVSTSPGPRWVVLWIAVLTADLWALSPPFLAVRPESDVYALSACVQDLARRRSADGPAAWRVLDRGLPRYPSSAPLGVALPPLGNVRLEPVLGYNTFDVRRTRQYLAFAAGSSESVTPRGSQFGYPILNPMLIENKVFFDLLGVRHLLAPAGPVDQPVLLPNHDGPGEPGHDPSWQAVGRDEAPAAYSFLEGGVVRLPPQVVYENTTVFPRAFVVYEARPLPPEKDVLATLRAADLRRTVFLEGWTESASPRPSPQSGTVHVVEHQPNRVVMQAEAGPAGYLVLADVWYPGWRCQIDGRPVPLYRADYLFRGVALPEGEHTVVFSFEPASYRIGRTISLIAAIGVAGIGLVRLFVRGVWGHGNKSQ